MKKRTISLLALGAAALLALGGCGSNRSSDGSVTGDDSTILDAQIKGVDNCTVCHSGITENWELSGHGNPNNRPDTAYYGHTSEECASCHDATGESADLGTPVVTCEACHGGGQYHSGVGPIPIPSPTIEVCAKCHNNPDGHPGALVDTVLASNHGKLGHNDEALCQRCHTAEGFRAFGAVHGSKDDLHAALDNATAFDPEETSAPTCLTCHDEHTGKMRAVTGWDPNNNGVSDQFDLCTSCHNYQLSDGTLFGSGSDASGTVEFYHDTAWYRSIASTHYDDPTTGYGLTVDKVEGYVLRTNSDNPCFDCHGHELKTSTRYAGDTESLTIHTEWAKSGHAGGLLNVVLADVAEIDCTDSPSLSHGRCDEQADAALWAGASDDSSNGGFTHYDWDSASRQDCQMCHTSTGFVNYVADPDTYDAANNDFSHLSGWTVGGNSGQNEMLYCWGCHSNAGEGKLRVSSAVTAVYSYGGESVVFPDSGNSNTCIVCHSGRGNNETVSTSSRFAGHHAPAAATLFSELTHVGAEYVGLDYSNKVYFAHDAIDVDGSGPCASCHMDSDNHEFAVVEKDAAGIVTGLKADVCVSCHDGEHALFVSQKQVGETHDIWNGVSAAVPTVVTQQMADDAAALLEHESESYQEAGQILLALVANTIPNHTGALVNQSSAEDDRRAFQNSKLTTEDKGGFAHNRYYVKRLIFDSIDWLEDGAIDGTIDDYSATYPDGAAWLGTSRP